MAFIWVVLLTVASLASGNWNSNGNYFLFAFPYNHLVAVGPSLQIHSISEEPGFVFISAVGIGFLKHFKIMHNEEVTVRLPSEIMSNIDHASGLKNNTITILTTNNVIVYAVVDTHAYSVDAFLVEPVTNLGSEHFVASSPPRYASRSQAMVTASCDGTTVAVKLTGAVTYQQKIYQNGDSLSFTLDSGQTFQITSENDITGSHIRASSPISVISGNSCGYTSDFSNACEYMATQIPPVTKLGKRYIVASFRLGDTVCRAIAVRNNTTVYLPEQGFAQTINAGEFYEFILDGDITKTLVADNPVLIAQYGTRGKDLCDSFQEYMSICNESHPSLSVITPVEQFVTSTIFSTINTTSSSPNSIVYSFSNHLILITDQPCGNAQYAKMRQNMGQLTDTVEKENFGFCTLSGKLKPGVHRITTGDDRLKFTAVWYGFSSVAMFVTTIGQDSEKLEYINDIGEPCQDDPLEVNPCVNNLCKNGATCSSKGNMSSCTCMEGFTGEFCEQDINDCEPNPCQNNGDCVDHVNSFICICSGGWQGVLCDLKEENRKQERKTSKGREFIFSFPENLMKGNGPSLRIITGSAITTAIRISYRDGLVYDRFAVLANSIKVIRLSETFMAHNADSQNIALYVESSYDIEIHAFADNHPMSMDGFMALPLHRLGQSYLIMTSVTLSHPRRHSEFVITATQDNTHVTVTFAADVQFPTRSFRSGQEAHFLMNRLDVLQFKSNADLTGTIVRSTFLVAITAGNDCGFIATPNVETNYVCEHMISMIPPLRSWGQTFVMAPFLGYESGISSIRILAAKDNTIVQRTGARDIILNRGDFSDSVMFDKTGVVIRSSRPILVAQFTVPMPLTCEGCDGKSSPSMVIIPPTSMFSDSLTFSTYNELQFGSYVVNFTNFATIVTKCENKKHIKVEGPQTLKLEWMSRNDALYCIARTRLPNGSYRISTPLHSVTVSVLLYGFSLSSTYILSVAEGISVHGITEIKEQDLTYSTLKTTNSKPRPNETSEYFIGFIQNGPTYLESEGPKLHLLNGNSPVDVNISSPGLFFQNSITLEAGESRVVELPSDAIEFGSRPINSAIYITSSRKITIYGINDVQFLSSDGFLALPVEKLGQEYYIASGATLQRRTLSRFSTVIIIATRDATKVAVSVTQTVNYGGRTFNPGDIIELYMNKLEAIQLESSSDLSGTYIRGDQRIAVFSGSDCGGVFYRYGPKPGIISSRNSCDHMVEQLIPASSWGSTFALVAFDGYTKSHTTARVIASSDRTFVNVGGEIIYVDRGQFQDIYLGGINKQALEVISNQPIQIVQYTVYNALTCNGCSGYSNPSMTIVPAMSHSISKVKFMTYNVTMATGSPRIYHTYMNIVTKCVNIFSLTINGKALKSAWSQVAGVSVLCYARNELAHGVYEVASVNGALFTCTLYSHTKSVSMAFPCDMNL
ncbi:uncharacterized protein LOC117108782 [Anneissia japonica]|uniref:uncharacterized protein LOC117108782 n=1 Tax=Anneissia japonica TaxID=1529436 RepID=UPI0014255773|nr:uncharacterized protein LOC117108782 [Anneissia japonica]